MGCKITVEPDYLRAELFRWEAAEEKRAFFRSIVLENKSHPRSRFLILIPICSSQPPIAVDLHRFIELLLQLTSGAPAHRIALVGDTREFHASHERVALIAQQRGLNVRNHPTEALALRWLMDRRQELERRTTEDQNPKEFWQPQENRRLLERRRFELEPQPT